MRVPILSPASTLALALALAPIALTAPAAAAGDLTCSTPPGLGAAFAAPHVVRIADPLGAAPVLHGAGAPLPARLFKRGRTWVFDAVREALYYDRDNHNFAYTRITDRPALIWRGTCRLEG